MGRILVSDYLIKIARALTFAGLLLLPVLVLGSTTTRNNGLGHPYVEDGSSTGGSLEAGADAIEVAQSCMY
jgi:hypothetical protein